MGPKFVTDTPNYFVKQYLNIQYDTISIFFTHATSNAAKSPYFVLGRGKSLPKFLDMSPPPTIGMKRPLSTKSRNELYIIFGWCI